NRQAAIQKEIQNWPPEQWIQDSEQFQQAKADAKGIRSYSAQEIAQGAKQGVWAQQNTHQGAVPVKSPLLSADTSNGMITAVSPQQIKPSRNYVQLRRAGIRLSYPDNWRAYSNSQSITITPAGGASQ